MIFQCPSCRSGVTPSPELMHVAPYCSEKCLNRARRDHVIHVSLGIFAFLFLCALAITLVIHG